MTLRRPSWRHHAVGLGARMAVEIAGDEAPDGCCYITPAHNIVEVLGAIQIAPDECGTPVVRAGHRLAWGPNCNPRTLGRPGVYELCNETPV